MKPQFIFERRDRFNFFVALALSVLIFSSGCARFVKPKASETPDLSQPRQSIYSAPITRLNSGFYNMLTGLVEPVNQLREEVKRTNPIQGLFPGLINGAAWLTVREVVGAFETLTFYLPLEPRLKPINLDWLTA